MTRGTLARLPHGLLQWGRGSSAAEGILKRLDDVLEDRLQWGRGSSAAEGWPPTSPSRCRASSFNGAAALQPRKGRVGGLQDQRVARFNGAAALQPRKEWLIQCDGYRVFALQWGRGSSAAEGRAVVQVQQHRVGVASMGPRLFSRGRDIQGAFEGAFCGFNGAAALQPRQGGPQASGCQRSRCFNGAAALQPRKG